MKRDIVIKHEFVEFIPSELKEETIYISIRFGTATHLCVCGCGNKVVTPIRPTDWKLIFDGKTISLDPSIGNWSFECQSHYWIRNNKIRWTKRWSEEEIEAGRAGDRWAKNTYFGESEQPTEKPVTSESARVEDGFWRRLKKKFWSQ